MKKNSNPVNWVRNHRLIAAIAFAGISLFVVITTTILLSRTPVSAPPNQSATTENVSLKGTLTCLPHRNNSGPQTLECAIGFKSDQGVYYSLTGQSDLISGTPFGKTVKVTGALKHQEKKIYQSSGIITVSELTPL